MKTNKKPRPMKLKKENLYYMERTEIYWIKTNRQMTAKEKRLIVKHFIIPTDSELLGSERVVKIINAP